MRALAFLFGAILILELSAYAQPNPKSCKTIKTGVSVILDSLSVAPSTISLSDSLQAKFIYNLSSGIIQVESHLDSVQVCYQVLPFSFHSKFSLGYELTDSVIDPLEISPITNSIPAQTEKLINSDDMNASGQFSRGLTAGSNRNAALTAGMNLSLRGRLADDLFIEASLTDQNIPYQPEGNAPEIRDFDNVSMRVYNDQFSIQAGDLTLNSFQSRYLKYLKNVQGGLLRVGSDSSLVYAGANVAKGQFLSISIQPFDGVAGPYRVRGPNNSLVVILANSEKVFLDGRRLLRGFNYDYVIDYNTGEITFMNRVQITRFSRIRVDFEFSDQNFNRSVLTAGFDRKMGQWGYYVNAYSERDNRNRPLSTQLSNSEKSILSSIGDSTQMALLSSIVEVGFQPDRVLYALVSGFNMEGNPVDYLVHSTHPDSAIFSAGFMEVGVGNGEYEFKEATANGRVYEYVGSIGGEKLGSFEPIVSLPAPNKKQMIEAGVNAKITPFETFNSQIGISNQDPNLFSKLHDEDNSGLASNIVFSSKGRPAGIGALQIEAQLGAEFLQNSFTPIDRFRPIEFEREWNGNQMLATGWESLFSFGAALYDSLGKEFSYGLVQRNKPGVTQGLQQNGAMDWAIGKLHLTGNGFLMSTDNSNTSSIWKRASATVDFRGKLIPGYTFSLDKNRVNGAVMDSTIASSQYFESHRFFLRTGSDSENRLNINYEIRNDFIPENGEMRKAFISQNLGASFDGNIGEQHIGLLAYYRILSNRAMPGENDESISARVDVRGNLLKSSSHNLTFSIANSRELRKEFVYLSVPTGEGTHTWRDQNDNNIQEFDEFFEAINIDERTHIRVFVPTSTYVDAFENRLNYRLNIRPPRAWANESGLKKMLGKWSALGSWNSLFKTTDDNLKSRLLPFATDVPDISVLSLRTNARSSFFFNRNSPVYGMSVTYLESERKTLLTNGFESRSRNETSLRARFRFNRQYLVSANVVVGMVGSGSDFLSNRNYEVDYHTVNPKLTWQRNNKIRMSLAYESTRREGLGEDADVQSSNFNALDLEGRASLASQTSAQFSLSLNRIQFTGNENSPLGYEMLQALKNGNNMLWAFSWTQKVFGGLQLMINYNGRKSEGTPVVHFGSVQLNALF